MVHPAVKKISRFVQEGKDLDTHMTITPRKGRKRGGGPAKKAQGTPTGRSGAK